MTTHNTNQAVQLQGQDLIQAQFARKIVARLHSGADEVPHDISERLRVARQQAIAQRKKPQFQTQLASAPSIQLSGGGAALGLGGGMGDESLGFFNRLASFFPLLALIVGLIAINVIQDDDRANELAEVDSALLTDDLPPAAYVDPGFSHFMKVSHDASQ